MNYPSHLQFTRQQIAELTGISDDVLAFWLKQQLLVANDETLSGKGRHKRFGFVQIHIAAILNQLRDFGVNISCLRSVSAILQAAVRTGERVFGEVHEYSETISDAGHLEIISERYSRGIKRYKCMEDGVEKYFETFEDYFADYVETWNFKTTLDESIALFRTLKPGEGHLIDLYDGLTSSDHLKRGNEGGRGWAEFVFAIAPSSNEDWTIVAYEEDSNSLKEWMAEPPSYISVRVSKLIRNIWTPDKTRAATQR